MIKMVTKMNKTLIVASLTIIIAIVGISSTFISISDSVSTEDQVMKGPAPRELHMWGKEIGSFEEAKTMIGFENANLPTSIPSGLSLKSVRVLQADDGAFKLLSVFYAPKGVTTGDTDTFEDIMANDGILLLYSYEKKSESFNWNSWVSNFVAEQPQDRKIQSISGKEVILVKGGSDPRATSQVYSKSGDILVNLVSKKYSEIDLSDIVKSINS